MTLKPGVIVFWATGNGAYEVFKHEPGGHRWQRVPPTEKRGRVQSSTVTVAVLKEPTTAEVRLDFKDLKIEAYKDSGPGGQHRNKTESAVRMTHLPTGITASSACKSQHRNKELALGVLRARLQETAEGRQTRERNKKRRNQVGLGQRGDKIRTVSEQNGVVTNHRTGKKMNAKRYERGFIEEIH